MQIDKLGFDALARERPRLPLEGKLSPSRATDEVCGEMFRFAGTTGEFVTLFHLIRRFAPPSPQGEGFGLLQTSTAPQIPISRRKHFSFNRYLKSCL
ncbi:MAG: hypothetical protein ACI4PT_02250 [Candidatus Avoscillospira sp.]